MYCKGIADIKSNQDVVFNHMHTLDNEYSNNHTDIIKIATTIGSR